MSGEMNVTVQVFSEHGLGSIVLTLEPSRYEHCGGSKRSDDLREFLEQGPGLLTRQAMLRTPFVWIQVRPTYSQSFIHHLAGGRMDPNVAKLFRPRFSAECHRWLNEPLSVHRQWLAHKFTMELTAK